MKNKSRVLTFLLTLLLVFSVSVAASAAAPEAVDKSANGIVLLEGGGLASSGDAESSDADNPTIQGEASDEPEAQDEAAPAPRKSGNTPYFIGAGMAVLMFAGVAVYCKSNGNKSF